MYMQYYTVPGSAPIQHLMSDAMVLARNDGYDVFNALNLLEVSQQVAQIGPSLLNG